ncbi:MAG: ABC transporter permease [Chloroflexota bacterium]
MSKIFAIAWKDTLVRFSDRSELLFFLILPLIFTFLLGGAGVGGATGINIAVVDMDDSSLSRQLIDAIRADTALQISLTSQADAEKLFNNREASAWLTIPQRYEADLLNGQQVAVELRKQPNDTSADGAERAIAAAVNAANRSLAVAHNSLSVAEGIAPTLDRSAYLTAGLAAAAEHFAATPTRLNVTRPIVETEGKYNQGTQASNGQLITWVFIPLVGISGLLAFERRSKTLERLVASPTRRVTYLAGMLIGQVGQAIVQMLLLVLFGVYVMKINWGSSLPALATVLLAFALAAAAMGIMMGTFIRTERQASNLSIMIGMVFALLGGCWWPMELFPPVMQNLARLLPTYWAMLGMNNLSMRGLGIESVWLPAAVLLGFAAGFFTIGIARFRYE